MCPISRLPIVLLLLLGGWCSATVAAQSTVRLLLRDSLTGESLPFANVTVAGRVVTADADGYALIARPLPDSIGISYVGYRSCRLATAGWSSDDAVRAVELAANADLPTVTVTLPAHVYGPSSSILTPSVAELVRTPVLLGETDLLKSLTLLPGISGGTEGTAALNIRGGNPNQTDLQIDGNRIYNVYHLGGLLSAVPAYGTKSLTVYKGGVPGRFGGRLSGVVDITLREGRRDRMARTYTVGLGTVQAGAEGPVGGSGSFLVHGRYSYPTALINLLNRGYYVRRESGTHTSVGLYDFVGKYRRTFGRQEVTFSTFVNGDDGFDQYREGTKGLRFDEFNWGNASFALNHAYRTRGGGVWRSALQYLRYRFAYRIHSNPGSHDDTPPVLSDRGIDSGIDDATFSSAFTQPIGRHLTLETGLQLTRHRLNADVRHVLTEEGETILSYRRDLPQRATEVGAYATADWQLLRDRLHLMTAVRVSGLGGVSPRAVEPRLRLAYNVMQEVYVNFSADRHYQYIHQLTPEIAAYPNELYLLATADRPAERSDQLAAGVGGLHGTLRWSAEVFTKRMDRLVRLRTGEAREQSFLVDFPDNVIAGGVGRVRGLELYLSQSGERFSYSVAYTLSRSVRRYAEISRGDWYPFTFDRPHDLSVTTSKALGEKYRVNAAWIYQTGHAYTAPVGSSSFYDIYGPYNGARLPAFHVLNLSLSREWRGRKRANRYHALTLSVYNTYNRPNAYTSSIRSVSRAITDPVSGETTHLGRLRVEYRSLFPVLPGVSYTVTVR